jgi:hypothetical protein
MDGFNGDDASDTLGYTPAHLVTRSFSEIFHDPGDSQPPTKKARARAAKPKEVYPYSVEGDPLLKKLEKMMADCAERHNCETANCEIAEHGFRCPNRDMCDHWWDRVAGKSSRHMLTQEAFEKYKGEFEEGIEPR